MNISYHLPLFFPSMAYPPPPLPPHPAVPLWVQALTAHQHPRVPGHRVGLAHPAPHALARVRPAQDDTARLSLQQEEMGGEGRGGEGRLPCVAADLLMQGGGGTHVSVCVITFMGRLPPLPPPPLPLITCCNA